MLLQFFLLICFIFHHGLALTWNEASLEGRCPEGCSQRYLDDQIGDIQEEVARCIMQCEATIHSHKVKPIKRAKWEDSKEFEYFIEGTKTSLEIELTVDPYLRCDDDEVDRRGLSQGPRYDVGYSRENKPDRPSFEASFALEYYPHFLEFIDTFRSDFTDIAKENQVELQQQLLPLRSDVNRMKIMLAKSGGILD